MILVDLQSEKFGAPQRGVTTPVSLVYLLVSLTALGPSGSTEPTRLCRGCSRHPRRSPDQAASSFTPPLRRREDGRSLTSIRDNSASWRRRIRVRTASPGPASVVDTSVCRRGSWLAAGAEVRRPCRTTQDRRARCGPIGHKTGSGIGLGPPGRGGWPWWPSPRWGRGD